MAFLRAAVDGDRGKSCSAVQKTMTVMETVTIITLKIWLFLLGDIRIQDVVEITFHLRLKVEVNNVFIASIYTGW